MQPSGMAADRLCSAYVNDGGICGVYLFSVWCVLQRGVGTHSRADARIHARADTGTHTGTDARTHGRANTETHFETYVKTHFGTHFETYFKTYFEAHFNS